MTRKIETTAEPQTCDSCRYYLEYEDLEEMDIETPEDLTGSCRRYPPQLVAGITAASVYPDVAGASGWCGEYMPK